MRPLIFSLMLLTLSACGVSAAPMSTPNPIARGGQLFLTQCGSCHTPSEVASDAFGPRLSAMYARAQAAPDPAAWLRAAITAPNAEIASGYQAGTMLTTYGNDLSPAELDALIAYMLQNE